MSDAEQPAWVGDSPVFLIGFMGAGKTTVGGVLARMAGYQFIDLDDVIEQRAGMTVRDVFAQASEAEFRRFESEAIEGCRNLRRTVIALGGGAYESAANREKLRAIGITVWIDCPVEVCLERIRAEETRPLLRDEGEMRSLFERRLSNYKLADHTVTGSLSPEDVASKIMAALGLN